MVAHTRTHITLVFVGVCGFSSFEGDADMVVVSSGSRGYVTAIEAAQLR